MKLYISYYGNYVSIVEGKYIKNKDKYNVKDVMMLSDADVTTDINDKYSLLKEALKMIDSKTKDVVFSLNTRDVIIKSNHIPKVSPKDLDGIMNNEMDDMMSLDSNQYTFSYEVTGEDIVDDREQLNVIIAAILNDELDVILNIFKDYKLNIECIDTMSTSYARLLNKIEYDDIMMLNLGRYGSLVNIYKNDSLFIHDNIPVRVNENANYSVAYELVEEVKGLNNFYSSRNYGKNIDTIVIVGESNDNHFVIDSFKEKFNSYVVVGVENLFDIENDIVGNLDSDKISLVCDSLGSMSIIQDKKSYYYMNLLPSYIKNKQYKKAVLKNSLLTVPVIIAVLATPKLIINAMESNIEKNIYESQLRLDEILTEYSGIETIENQIEKAKEEIGIYDMLSSKKVQWENILKSIESNIPYRADLNKINVYYDDEINIVDINSDSANSSETSEETNETPIYEQVPNIIEIEGTVTSTDKVGEFVYSLNKINYFKSVELKSSSEDKENGGYTFHIVLEVNEDAIYSE